MSENVIANDGFATTLANRTYVYDTVGNLTAQTENGTFLIYTYDNLNRLTSVSDGNTVTSAGET